MSFGDSSSHAQFLALKARVKAFEALVADPTLIALAGLDSTGGVVVQTGPDTFVKRPYREFGEVVDFAGATAPSLWLLCFGQSLLRADYPDLFAAISTTHGAADGTHFNLPDYRGRVGAGQDDMGGASANRLTAPINGDTLGAVGGAETVTLTTAEMPAHDHGGTTGTEAAHTHTVPGTLTGGAISSLLRHSAGTSSAQIATTSAGSSHDHPISSQGSGTPATIVQPTIIINKIIYAGV